MNQEIGRRGDQEAAQPEQAGRGVPNRSRCEVLEIVGREVLRTTRECRLKNRAVLQIREFVYTSSHGQEVAERGIFRDQVDSLLRGRGGQIQRRSGEHVSQVVEHRP